MFSGPGLGLAAGDAVGVGDADADDDGLERVTSGAGTHAAKSMLASTMAATRIGPEGTRHHRR
jgi:hypothetical protein